MNKREKRKQEKDKLKRINSKKEFAKAVNNAGISCGFCKIKNRNKFFYCGIGFCSDEHLQKWKQQRGLS